ncbi:exo-beta-N-acetylmuramidase NamZ family protein [Prosthecochloris vibrioformis]|uniref:DUF1343 domain-containing protein n=1 Tax=Prosthecochloris vibrioformis TaxID=1098 RepID=A0A5C4RYV3_PROVB|nr:DUF1343 domain-containing protein [Prosthecochloris vibrioformis]TNJ36310.1 DUF1343 domain-containing protein [Prosthecochloris vibrioformis]
MNVVNGLDRFLEGTDQLGKRNFALLANQTSVTASLRYSWEVLAEQGRRPVRIFSPEHGLYATEQDQAAVALQPETGLEIISLYGSSYDSLLPDPGLLEDIDLLIFDIQDVGSRYYTYVNTMAMMMERLSGSDIEVMVLDRPNPLGGIQVEGPMPDPAYRSFVGVFPVPVRHGLTAGELALLYREEMQLDLDLKVVTMQGWDRNMNFSATELPWVSPSPNMPTPETALVYPGMCLLEGTNLSEGRGTTMPFQQFGAPFIQPERVTRRLAEMALTGVTFRPTYFKPTFHKFKDDIAGGLFLHVTDPLALDAFATGVALTIAIHQEYPGDFHFLEGVYEFNDNWPAFDLLCGSGEIRKQILKGVPFDTIRASWLDDQEEFRTNKERYHLY